MRERISKAIDRFIFVGTGVVALSGLFIYFGEEHGRAEASRDQRAALEQAALLAITDSRKRVNAAIAGSSASDTMRAGRTVGRTKLGGVIHMTIDRTTADDAVIALDYAALDGRDTLSFADEDGRPISTMASRDGIYILPLGKDRVRRIRCMMEGTFLELIDLEAGMTGFEPMH